jgi:Uma2 family endonuclease
VVGTDTGVLLERNPDTVREPDVAFVSADRLPLDVRPRGYLEVVPDLVAEVISPNASPVEVNDKTQMWLRYGVRLVWEVDPEARTVTAHYPDRPYATFGEDDMLDGGDVLPGFSCPVRDIFDL